MSNSDAIYGLVDTLCRLGLITSGYVRYFLSVDLEFYFENKGKDGQDKDSV
jgi:hypothetical protein